MGSHRFLSNVLLLLLAIVLAFSGCVKRMSIEEARQVTITMTDRPFVPPPRHINDILMLLNQQGQFDREITAKHEAIAKKFPPEVSDERTLAKFYLERGQAALQLYWFNQGLDDFRKALHYSEQAGLKNSYFLNRLATIEIWAGNFKRAIELLEDSLQDRWPSSYMHLVKIYAYMGDLESAEKIKKKGINRCRELSGVMPKIHVARMKTYILEAQGKFFEAEKQLRYILTLVPSIKIRYPIHALSTRSWLAKNLKDQNRLFEAELEARRALKMAIGHTGRDSFETGYLIGLIGEIAQKQGRLQEAEKLIRTGIQIIFDSDIAPDSFIMGHMRMKYGEVLSTKGDFVEALQQFYLARNDLLTNQYLYEKVIKHNPNLILALLMTDRTKEAIGLISSAYDIYVKNFGENHYFTAEILGLSGIANVKLKDNMQALKEFSKAIPALLDSRSGYDMDYSRRQRVKIIIGTYLELLTQIHGTQLEHDSGIKVSLEAFILTDTLHESTVRSAIRASCARAAITDPDLADLARREQDAIKLINVLQTTLTNSIAAPQAQQLPEVIERLKIKIKTLTKARMSLLDEIKRRFPKYSAFTNPQPVTFSQVQNYLCPGEVMISIYTDKAQTYVWAIPHKGEVKFSAVPLGKKKIHKIITNFRSTLDPEPVFFGDIPEFDLVQAYDLYIELLKPFEEVWKDATDLLIVAHGPLDQIPFSILPTDLARLGHEKGELFSKYRKVSWLIKKVSITRLPSASSFVTLRTLPKGGPFRKAFAGFADPFFTEKQLLEAKNENVDHNVILTKHKGSLHVRGIRLTETGSLDSEKITSSHLGMLNRLPDTAEEIISIAKALDADPVKDVFLGEKASEGQVKTIDLSDRKVIAFATHALVPGDLDGLGQPALALCSPSITRGKEDGLLTMGEIMRLRMNADWVVLSACNTGAAEGAGAEAVSGLGRAFFYAGTRALLVSMWPVETTSAKKLTTGLFRHQKENPKLSRARALRNSILELIDGPGLQDKTTGKIVASYAHPIFWAPFIIVGESGRDSN